MPATARSVIAPDARCDGWFFPISVPSMLKFLRFRMAAHYGHLALFPVRRLIWATTSEFNFRWLAIFRNTESELVYGETVPV